MGIGASCLTVVAADQRNITGMVAAVRMVRSAYPIAWMTTVGLLSTRSRASDGGAIGLVLAAHSSTITARQLNIDLLDTLIEAIRNPLFDGIGLMTDGMS